MTAENTSRLGQFFRDTDGSATAGGIVFLLTSAVVLGLALDQANGWRVRTQMQVAADAAALAGSALLDDPAMAKATALVVANKNLGETGQITADDIVLGRIDPTTKAFLSGPDAAGKYDSVVVTAERSIERDNALPTYLMKLIGINSFDVTAMAQASARRGGGGGAFAGCEDAVYLSSSVFDTGGGNRLEGAVCIHGQQGVRTGGNDWYGDEVRLSAQSLNNVTVATANKTKAEVAIARDMMPVIIPQLNAMHATIYNSINGTAGSRYYGDLLPSFLKNAQGFVNIVRVNTTWWTIQSSADLQPNTVYLAPGGVQFAGNVDTSKVAIIAQQAIQVGGGGALKFDQVYFFGSDLNMAGNVTWGGTVDPCTQTDYRVYLFGKNSLSLGGWGGTASVKGVVGAAPRFAPGGAITAQGVYFESSQYTPLGGNLRVLGCGNPRTSSIELADLRQQQAGNGISGSFLSR